MPNRTDLLNFLAEKYNLQRYLELGVQVKALNFDKIKCQYKYSVDPDPKADARFQMTSDAFFEVIQDKELAYRTFETEAKEALNKVAFTDKEKEYFKRHVDKMLIFDLIFIDGLHTAEQVKKDFENALKVLSPNGWIVIHDCNPEKEEHTIVPRPTERGHWNGSVYKFAASMPKYPFWTVDIDNGCMVVKPEKDYFNDGIEWPKYIDWQFFDKHRKELLNLTTWDEFVKS